MILRIINGLYRRFVLPVFIKKSVCDEQKREEYLVMQNIPSNFLTPLTKEEKNSVRITFMPIIRDLDSFRELEIFKHYRSFDARYVSHYIYLPIIAHKLNNYHYSKILEHKSLLGYLVKSNLKFPACYIRCIDNEYYDNDMAQLNLKEVINKCIDEDELIVKDSVDSAGGKSVVLVKLSGLEREQRIKAVKQILVKRKNDFVIQEYIKQHPDFAKFNETSINTLRVTTLYLNGEYSTLSIVLRFGKKGMKVDNWGSGGIVVGVSDEGKLNKIGYDITLNEFHGYNGITFEYEIIAQIPSLLKKIEFTHKNQFSLCKLIGWDVCFNEKNEPVIIELNSSQPGIICEQLCTGPIFGERTEEVVSYCAEKEFVYQRSIFQY